MARDAPERLTTDWGPSDYDPDEDAFAWAEDEQYFGPSPEPVVGEPVVMGAAVVLAGEQRRIAEGEDPAGG